MAERQLKIIDKVMADMKEGGKGVREDFIRFNKAKVIFFNSLGWACRFCCIGLEGSDLFMHIQLLQEMHVGFAA